MFNSHKVKIEGELLDRVRQCVKAGGYESIDAFIFHVLEKEMEKIHSGGDGEVRSRELTKKRLQGLGYID